MFYSSIHYFPSYFILHPKSHPIPFYLFKLHHHLYFYLFPQVPPHTLLSFFISVENSIPNFYTQLTMYVTRQIQNKIQKKKINIHQRSILRQMMNTCDKLDSSFLTRVQQKKFQQKQKQEKQLIRKTSFIDKQNLQRFSHDPFKCTKDNIMQDFVFVKESKEIKQIKDLKQKMLPKVNKTNIQKKLKELTYIRNMGFKTKNKRLESFKSLTREQDEQNILNKSWQNFYQDKIFNSPVETPSQQQEQKEFVRSMERKRTKNATFILRKDTMDSNADPNDIRKSLLRTCNKFTESSPSSFMKKESKLGEIPEINFNRTSSEFMSTGNSKYIFENKTTQLPVPPTSRQRESRISARNKAGFKETIKSLPRSKGRQSYNPQMGLHMLSSDRKKEVTDKMGFTKDRLEKQNAYKLYSLIRGGYDLDRNEVQGEHISLKRFKEAKENFKILNSCFNKVRQYRYIIQEPQKMFNDQSFKSLVYLSQIQNKIPPSLFKKVQKINNVVD